MWGGAGRDFIEQRRTAATGSIGGKGNDAINVATAGPAAKREAAARARTSSAYNTQRATAREGLRAPLLDQVTPQTRGPAAPSRVPARGRRALSA